MPPPSIFPITTGSLCPTFCKSIDRAANKRGNGPGYYHVGSPPDPGYAGQMRAVYGTSGREDIDPPRYDPPRRDLQTSSSQPSQRAVWQSRPGQGIPAFPGSNTRGIDSSLAAYRRTIQLGTTKVPKLTKTTLVNTEVHLFIQYIHQLLLLMNLYGQHD